LTEAREQVSASEAVVWANKCWIKKKPLNYFSVKKIWMSSHCLQTSVHHYPGRCNCQYFITL